MRPQFREHLGMMSELAKEAQKEDLTGEEEKEVKSAISFHIKKRARDRFGSAEAQAGIFDIQKQKQEIMDRLKEDIAALDDPDHRPERGEASRLVAYNEHNKRYYLIEQGMQEITRGEIMTDGEWGVLYHLNAETVPRNIRKRYLIEQAKEELRALLDAQIIADESSSQKLHEWKREAYQSVSEQRETGQERPGIVAERMVRNFLKKLSLDLGLDIEIIEADIYQDVEQKIDFIIRRKVHLRGVGVEADDKRETIGVQFTTDQRAETAEHKKQQIMRSKQRLGKEDRVQDILLVQIPAGQAMGMYRNWSAQKTPGGPDKLWPQATKEHIFRSVLEGILLPKEIDNEWRRIAAK